MIHTLHSSFKLPEIFTRWLQHVGKMQRSLSHGIVGCRPCKAVGDGVSKRIDKGGF